MTPKTCQKEVWYKCFTWTQTFHMLLFPAPRLKDNLLFCASLTQTNTKCLINTLFHAYTHCIFCIFEEGEWYFSSLPWENFSFIQLQNKLINKHMFISSHSCYVRCRKGFMFASLRGQGCQMPNDVLPFPSWRSFSLWCMIHVQSNWTV